MNFYVVITNIGPYVQDVHKVNAYYQGIDRFTWPLSNEDYKLFKDIYKEEYAELIKYMDKRNGIYYPINPLCKDLLYTEYYIRVCNILEIPVEMLTCTRNDEEIEKINGYIFKFLGYELVLENTDSSCIIWEKKIIDSQNKIPLNKYGLIDNMEDCIEFKKLRFNVPGLEGLETGDESEYEILKLFKSMKKDQ